MDLEKWAENEIDIAINRLSRREFETDAFEYDKACCNSAYKAYKSLLEDGHSGCSFSITAGILNRLIDGKPLTPIEDIPEIWSWSENEKTAQCKRMPSLFKDIDDSGRVYYTDTQRFTCYDVDDPNRFPYYNGWVSRLLHEIFPISMPYSPASKPWEAYCSEFLYDPKNGDFDTIAIWYVIKPDGERVAIERFAKEEHGKLVEIDEDEFKSRSE